MIPGLNDHEIEALLAAARDAGAPGAGYVVLRLPREVGPLFRDWLERHYPGPRQAGDGRWCARCTAARTTTRVGPADEGRGGRSPS